MDVIDDAETPPDVELYDFDNHQKHRELIFKDAKETLENQFPRKYRDIRVELSDVHYADPEHYTLKQQHEAYINDKYLNRRLRGTLTLLDEKTGEELDKKTTTLMRVPYLTDRGTFIYNGSDLASSNQARLMPGIYTRRQKNGELETQFNVRAGTGNNFRISFNPETTQYRMAIRGGDLHLYSILHDIGVSDEEIEKAWGPEILKKNKDKYDKNAIVKAYNKVVPEWAKQGVTPSTNTYKEAILNSLNKALVSTNVLNRTLPSLMLEKRSNFFQKNASLFKTANLSAAEIKGIILFLNKEFNAGLPVEGTKESLENSVIIFLQQNGINPALLQKPETFQTVKIASTLLPDEELDTVPDFVLDDDGEEYTKVGTDSILAASKKLVDVNRGYDTTDDRDNLSFKKIYRTNNLIRERIKMDADKLQRTMMYQAANRRNLSYVSPLIFDPYALKHLIGNQLTASIEEINPMQYAEQSRRITLMGPGGLKSSQSITSDAQNVSGSQFGFIDVLAGPESERAGVDTRASLGTKIGSNGRLYQKFYDKRAKKYKWLSPEDISGKLVKINDVYSIPDQKIN